MANKPVAAQCNLGCEKEFTITKFRNKKVKNGIEKTFFRCPHCKHEYVSFYASDETRRLQKDMRKLQVVIKNAASDKEYENHLERYMALKAEIKLSMDDARVIATE